MTNKWILYDVAEECYKFDKECKIHRALPNSASQIVFTIQNYITMI
jgi:hypothetical protein